jgi:hypothetical protein
MKWERSYQSKPYVIYGYAAIPAEKKAVFNAGSHVYFHANLDLS